MIRQKSIFISLLMLMVSFSATAKVRLPHILCDNMVLQQQTDVQLWGWATPQACVSIKPSWGNKQVVKADKNGRWNLRMRTPKGGYTPLSITFSEGNSITLHNILSGEVWVCGGQSNMEMPLKGFNDCPVEGYQEAIAESGDIQGIRYAKIPATMRTMPQDDAECHWEIVNPNTANECSAIGYFFACRLHKMIDMPIGLILANKGGTRVESWLEKDYLKQHTNEPTDSANIVRQYPTEWQRPLLWGNGTFHPILNYTVRGILFYQGCSNVGQVPTIYGERLTQLIGQWRKEFQSPNLPFYFVEIAPYNYGNTQGTDAALLRMQQQRVAQNVSNTVLIGTNDLVYPSEADQIHPCQKRQIGERLAMTAAARDYGFENIYYRCPSLDRVEIHQDICYVYLKDTYNGIAAATSYEGFEIAGNDGVYHPAQAQYLHNGKFVLTSLGITKPVNVRYCYHNFQLGTVKNQAGLPLLPFSTN